MPGPIIAKPQLPGWMDPAQASVFDVPGQGMLRKLVGMLGLDDPQQVMAFGTPLETGAATGGLLDAVAAKFPRFANAIKAYHGSPHDFEEFKTSAIGTGEGAQAYGHGLYFAENPAVAEDYKKALAGRVDPKVGPHRVPDWVGNIIEAEHAGQQHQYSIDRTIQEFKARIGEAEERVASQAPQWWNDQSNIPGLQETLKGLQAAKEGVPLTRAGKMYEVAIGAHPDQFLDWDKPLSQQSEHVQKALAAVPAERTIPGPMEVRQNIYGDNKFYLVNRASGEWGSEAFPTKAAAEASAPAQTMRQRVLSPSDTAGTAYARLSDLYQDPAVVSQKLKEAGIPGIKYLDRGSRAAGEGSRNFVVFDDATVAILRKYGILPPVAGAALGSQQQDKE